MVFFATYHMKAFSYAMIAFLLLAINSPVLFAHAQTNQSGYNMTGPGGHHGHGGLHTRMIIRSVIIAAIVGVGGYVGWRVYKKKKSKGTSADVSQS